MGVFKFIFKSPDKEDICVTSEEGHSTLQDIGFGDVETRCKNIAERHNVDVILTFDPELNTTLEAAPCGKVEMDLWEGFTLLGELRCINDKAKVSEGDPQITEMIEPACDEDFEVVGLILKDDRGRTMSVGVVNRHSGLMEYTVDALTGDVFNMDCEQILLPDMILIGKYVREWYVQRWQVAGE